ncbi:serine/threonine protein kinase [Archangium lansingense]|uniref:Protein kinase n=1 Tax=Archangium lansingense TaxID=2995310 RepID=A0ABT4A073_9BACT|nr:protein kinase [Archangium lansinium]MCY1075048.1 protein kinase [Archangium lansinium]
MRKAVHPNQLRPRHRVREYRVVRRLATGGFSLVFLVEKAGQPYVMKMALQPASDAEADHADGWMRREAVSLEHLAHPHLLPVHELGRWPDPRTGYSFFITDHVPGDTFHDWRLNVRATPHQWVGVLIAILRPLEMMHERGICHRDLKADNILVREGDGWPFLIDLGAVHLPCARPLTQGLAPGTLYCQPPEAIRFLLGKEALEEGSRFEARPTADLYAIGILLYEALTGLRPFNPELPLDQLLSAIVAVTPAEPRQHAPQAPASLSALAMRLLAKEPAQRPASARAVREELERLRAEEGQSEPWRMPAVPLSKKGKGGGGGECGSTPALEGAQPEPGPAGAPEDSASAGRARHWPGVLVEWCFVLGLLGLGWWWLHPPPHVEPTAPAPPALSKQGAPPVPSSQNPQDPSATAAPPEASPLWCAMRHAVWGVALAQLAGCVTTPPVRPDPSGFLARCPPEARATPIKLGFVRGELHPTFLASGTEASSESSRDENGPINLKPGPVRAYIYPIDDDQELIAEGEAEITPMRVYIRLHRIQLPDGSWLPICGAAVSTFEKVFGAPTYEGYALTDARLDQVDCSAGSTILNTNRFETLIEPPEGEPRPRVRQVDPEAKPELNRSPPAKRQRYCVPR